MRGDHQLSCEILKRAAEFVRGEDGLAQRLGVRSEDMAKEPHRSLSTPQGKPKESPGRRG
jgi:hypothetical protein